MTNTRQQKQSGGVPRWVDWIIFVIIATVSVASVGSMLTSGAMGSSLTGDSLLSWHIARSAGLSAYMLLTASTLWGLFLSTRLIKDWTPGSVSLLFHATVSWLAVALMFIHVGMLLFDKFYTYTLVDLFVPFVGPYRPFAVGLGVIAAWLTFAVTISFAFRKVIGQKAWRLLHYTSYGAFALVTVHTILAGTDMAKPGMWIVVLGFFVLSAVLLYWRVRMSMDRKSAKALEA